MIDVMVKPDSDPRAGETATVGKFFYYRPEEQKARAREALRRLTGCNNDSVPLYRTDDGSANVALEELWNILAGNY